MEKIDLVVVGAEGVVESGGIINKVGRHLRSFMYVSLICDTMCMYFYINIHLMVQQNFDGEVLMNS